MLEHLQGSLLAALEGPGVDALGLDDAHERFGVDVVPGRQYGPLDGLMPFSLMVIPSSRLTYRAP